MPYYESCLLIAATSVISEAGIRRAGDRETLRRRRHDRDRVAPTSWSTKATWPGAETWHRILNAIERLQAKAPAAGEKV